MYENLAILALFVFLYSIIYGQLERTLFSGTVDFNTLITTLASNTQLQDLHSLTQGSVSTNLVQVYKALGGGWQIRDDRDPVEQLPASMKKQMRERTEAWDGVLR